MSVPQRPKVSRKPLVLVIALCLVLSGVLIPVGAHLPRWVEAEIVLAVWWLVWVCMLTALLFRGEAVDDDTRWLPFGGEKSGMMLDSLGILDPVGCIAGEGCATVILTIAAVLLAGLALMVLVEFIVPAIALLLLASIGGMLARAVNDRHECAGRFGASLLWGAVWATLYIGPVAAAVLWLSTMVHRG